MGKIRVEWVGGQRLPGSQGPVGGMQRRYLATPNLHPYLRLQRSAGVLPVTDLLDRLQAAVADHYTIERELGSGGMAIVYLAEDRKHHRKVAVKVLRPELAASLGADRFLREIEISAQLTHPNILTLIDSGEAAGLLYYTMPYVEGESLRERLDRDKQLPVEEALRITREIADAVSYAHGLGVIHRDIKPENILFEAGHAVVSDFGIARAVSEAGAEGLTETGLAVGTPAYMSPEQAGGAKDLGARTDVYSIGSMLYEMLAGEPPFTGATPQAIMARKSLEAVPPLRHVRETVPPAVEQAITRALAKVPADRFATVHQLSEALAVTEPAPGAGAAPAAAYRPGVRRRVVTYAVIVALVAVGSYLVISRVVGSAGPGATEPPRLAVLPFDNLGGTEDEYFADGITEELTSRIAEISGLRVISRQSAVQYKDSDKPLREIGNELNVDYVLEGTIRTDRPADGAGQVRVTPQLIRVADDAHLWTDRYTVSLVAGEIFGVQAEIAEEVARALDVTLLEPERRRLTATPTENLEAYEYYLRGIDYFLRGYDDQASRAAVLMFENAVAVDPDFAVAYARLCRAQMRMWWLAYDRTEQRVVAAKEAVDQALRLAPDLPEAHWALGWYYYQAHLDYESALAEFAIVQRSQPNSSELFFGIAAVQRRQGKFEEALANFKKALELDPRSAVRAIEVAETYALLRDRTEAEPYFDRAISLSPDWAKPYENKATWLYLRLEGNTERATHVLERAEQAGLGGDLDIMYARILLEMWAGDYEEALERLASVASSVLRDLQDGFVPKAQVSAEAHGLVGNRQLERAYYDSARVLLEARVEESPDDPRYRSALGIAYAGLARKEDAIREGEAAVELLPMSKEAYMGAIRAEDLARIYTMVGEHDAAVDQLEILLAVPSQTARAMLQIEPTWAPLHDHPRFQELVAGEN
jgi:serine/threonine-protein kinase